MTQRDDQILIEQTLSGDSSAFDVLVQRYRREVYSTARRYLHDSADVEDVLQDALGEAYLQLGNLQDPNKFPQWLHAIVRNRCISHLRSRPRHVSYEETALGGEIRISETLFAPAPDESFARRENEQTVHTAISKLSEKNRSVTVLHYLQSKSYEEIAAELQVPISTIEGRLYRARKQLKEELLKMTDIDQGVLQHRIEEATKGLQEDIARLKQRLAIQGGEDGRLDQKFGAPKYGDDISRGIITQVAHDLEHDISHLPPLDAFSHFSKPARIITLIQAIPLSLSPQELSTFKAGKKMPLKEFNPAQQEYLRAIVGLLEGQPQDFSSTILSFDPTHERDDDHAHLVIEVDSGGYSSHIDAFLMDTGRAGWY